MRLASGEPYERGRAEIDVPHGRVFVGTSDHGLYALRASDGSTLSSGVGLITKDDLSQYNTLASSLGIS